MIADSRASPSVLLVILTSQLAKYKARKVGRFPGKQYLYNTHVPAIQTSQVGACFVGGARDEQVTLDWKDPAAGEPWRRMGVKDSVYV